MKPKFTPNRYLSAIPVLGVALIAQPSVEAATLLEEIDPSTVGTEMGQIKVKGAFVNSVTEHVKTTRVVCVWDKMGRPQWVESDADYETVAVTVMRPSASQVVENVTAPAGNVFRGLFRGRASVTRAAAAQGGGFGSRRLAGKPGRGFGGDVVGLSAAATGAGIPSVGMGGLTRPSSRGIPQPFLAKVFRDRQPRVSANEMNPVSGENSASRVGLSFWSRMRNAFDPRQVSSSSSYRGRSLFSRFGSKNKRSATMPSARKGLFRKSGLGW